MIALYFLSKLGTNVYCTFLINCTVLYFKVNKNPLQVSQKLTTGCLYVNCVCNAIFSKIAIATQPPHITRSSQLNIDCFTKDCLGFARCTKFMLFTKNSKNKAKQRTAKPAQIQIHIVISIYIPPSTLTLFIKTAHYFSFFLFLFK